LNVDKVAKAIAYLRKRAGYTQKDLAERLGVSDKAVSKWERALGLPDVSCLRKLSILLDTDTDSLLAGDVIHHDSGWYGILCLDQTQNGIGLQTMIYDKPMVYFLLGYFLLVGIKKILIVCSDKEIKYMKSQFGNGNELGVELCYSSEPASEALAKSITLNDCSNCMIVYGRSLIYGVDQTRFFQKAMAHKDRLTVLSLPRGSKPTRQKLCFDNDKKIICATDGEELTTQYDYYDIPVVFCPKNLLNSVIEAIAEGSIAENSALKNRYLYTEVLDRGFVEISIDTWEDVMEASCFIRIVQRSCGMILYCPEEIAWRRGMISANDLVRLGKKQSALEYGRYLLSLVHE